MPPLVGASEGGARGAGTGDGTGGRKREATGVPGVGMLLGQGWIAFQNHDYSILSQHWRNNKLINTSNVS